MKNNKLKENCMKVMNVYVICICSLIILAVIVSIGIMSMKEKFMMTPFINPINYTALKSIELNHSTDRAPDSNVPWIPNKTPIPPSKDNYASEDPTAMIYSVDPGAHVKCARKCRKNSQGENDNSFLQICIDTCLQELWTHPMEKSEELTSTLDQLLY